MMIKRSETADIIHLSDLPLYEQTDEKGQIVNGLSKVMRLRQNEWV